MVQPAAKRHKMSPSDSVGQAVNSEATPATHDVLRQPDSNQEETVPENLSVSLRSQFETIANIGNVILARLDAEQNNHQGGSDALNNPMLASSDAVSLLEELKALKLCLTEKDKELASLEAEIEAKKSQLQRQSRQLEKHGLEQMGRQNPLTISQGAPDSPIIDSIEMLILAIRNLAQLDFKGLPLKKPSKAKHREAFGKLTKSQDKYESYLTNVHHKAYIIEAVIWDCLIEDLIGAPLAVYTGSADIEEAMRPHFQANNKDYPAWRAGTANLLCNNPRGFHEAWQPDGTKSAALVERLVELLIRFHCKSCEEDLEREIHSIVQKAVKLAGLIASCRAFWVVTLASTKLNPTIYDQVKQSLRCGFSVTEEYTKVLHLFGNGKLGGDKVDLVVRPLLLKWGDTSGRNYDVCQVMRRREVIATAT